MMIPSSARTVVAKRGHGTPGPLSGTASGSRRAARGGAKMTVPGGVG